MIRLVFGIPLSAGLLLYACIAGRVFADVEASNPKSLEELSDDNSVVIKAIGDEVSIASDGSTKKYKLEPIQEEKNLNEESKPPEIKITDSPAPVMPRISAHRKRGASFAGVILFASKPVSQRTREQPIFWLRDEATGEQYTGYRSDYNAADGSFVLYDLPPTKVGIKISFQLSGPEESYPGNLTGWQVVDWENLPEDERFALVFTLTELLHLIAPYDNGSRTLGLAKSGADYPKHRSPIRFRWKRVAGVTSYRVTVGEYRDPDHPKGYGRIKGVIDKSIYKSDFKATLRTSKKNTHYEFQVKGYNERSELVTSFQVNYKGKKHGWSYRFKVG